MDAHTEHLRDVLHERDRLRLAALANDRALTLALRNWSDTRPGQRGGIATEAGARFILGQAGILEKEPTKCKTP